MHKKEWVKLPTQWVLDHGLHKFSWDDDKSGNIAALMILVIIAHNAEPDTGLVHITYDSLQKATGLSRPSISSGLGILGNHQIIKDKKNKQSKYILCNYPMPKDDGWDPKTQIWGKIPCDALYDNKIVSAFKNFHLRKRMELDALKIYFLFITFRDNGTNLANVSYEKITEYTNISRNYIKPALSLLSINRLVYAESQKEAYKQYTYNVYRLPQIAPYQHGGTSQPYKEFAI